MLKRIFLFIFLFFSIFLALTITFYFISLSPVDPQNQAFIDFTVPKGQPAQLIAKRLKELGLIKSSFVFKLLIYKKNLSNQLQAGKFQLSPAMSLEKIIDTLTKGSQDYWITFPEGLRVEEYAELLANKNPSIDKSSFILAAKPFEGRLFPDTYRIPQSESIEGIVQLLTDTFKSKSPTEEDKVIIIASLIEREAKHQSDRALISGVIYNRLSLGMPLQVDATIQYIIGRSGNWWPKNLSKEDLQINSPFNTYLNPGLPPKPIANPGLASLKAALNPAKTNYLYYLSDAQGNNHYAASLEEHNQNIAKYLNR